MTSDARNRFWQIRMGVLDGRPVTTLTQIMAINSLHITGMMKARVASNFQSVYDHWSAMEALNTCWVQLVMSPFKYRSKDQNVGPVPTQTQLDRLHKIAFDMARGYTSTIAELVLSGKVSVGKLERMVEAESNFYSTVMRATPQQQHETRQHWYAHTNSVIQLMDTYDADDFDHLACRCIKHGKLLGAWLDGIFLL